jgi:D-3-phosphoglycerate dehydrogenase
MRGRRPVVAVAALELPTFVLDVEEEVFSGLGAAILDLRDRPLEELRSELATADALLTEGLQRVDAEVIEGLERCRVISVYAVGTDGVDVACARARGIVVAHVPDYCSIDVAEHTMALILAAWRRLPLAERVARTGDWSLDDLRPVHRLYGRTLGLLGYGRIAREVALRARALGVEVLAHDPYVTVTAGDGVTLCDRDELFRSSDVLSIHLPSTPATAGAVDARALALLPRGAIVVNAGRGAVLDEDALLQALRSGHVRAAALDVLCREPAPPDHPLLALDTVICTPHMGYYSEESLVVLRRAAAENALAVLEGRTPAAIAP